MIDSKFLFTFVGLIVAVFAICKTNFSSINEGWNGQVNTQNQNCENSTPPLLPSNKDPAYVSYDELDNLCASNKESQPLKKPNLNECHIPDRPMDRYTLQKHRLMSDQDPIRGGLAVHVSSCNCESECTCNLFRTAGQYDAINGIDVSGQSYMKHPDLQ